MNQTYTIKVISRSSETVVKEMSANGVRNAGKVVDGISINLNKNAYYVTMELNQESTK